MSEERRIFSLLQVAQSVQKTLDARYTSSFWIKAEINKLNYYPLSGHAYPELVEKVEGRIVAEMRSLIWKTDFDRIQNKFISQIKEPLKNGIKVLMEAKISYSPVYGLTLQISDIDPMLTLGDLEKEKSETISELRKLGIFDQNKQKSLALIPQRIAVISVETSKGWSDFLEVIRKNSEGYDFFIQLFPAILQGDKAPKEIRTQLKKVASTAEKFDAVAIIRGGGGDVGLSCYNHFELCRDIASFPIPVFTGIGHSTNETVSEMVSHTNAITPTKLAEFLIQRFRNFEQPMDSLLLKMKHLSVQYVNGKQHLFESTQHRLRNTVQLTLQSKGFAVQQHQQKLSSISKERLKDLQFKTEQTQVRLNHHGWNLWQTSFQKLNLLEEKTNLLSPVHVLKRGFSITRLNGKSVTDASSLKMGDVIETEVLNGSFTSTLENKKS